MTKIKNFIIVVVMLIWTSYMLAHLIKWVIPEPFLWGIPGGIWLTLNPPIVYNLKDRAETQK